MTISKSQTTLALLDANILVYADQEEDEHHQAARALREQGRCGELAVCVTPQVLFEYFAVVTNPRRVTQPRSPEVAMAEVEKYLLSRHIRKIYPGPTILNRVRTLFQEHPVSGPVIFDLHLLATMLENGVKRLYTFNVKDFAPFFGIEVIAPLAPQPARPSG